MTARDDTAIRSDGPNIRDETAICSDGPNIARGASRRSVDEPDDSVDDELGRIGILGRYGGYGGPRTDDEDPRHDQSDDEDRERSRPYESWRDGVSGRRYLYLVRREGLLRERDFDRRASLVKEHRMEHRMEQEETKRKEERESGRRRSGKKSAKKSAKDAILQAAPRALCPKSSAPLETDTDREWSERDRGWSERDPGTRGDVLRRPEELRSFGIRGDVLRSARYHGARVCLPAFMDRRPKKGPGGYPRRSVRASRS